MRGNEGLIWSPSTPATLEPRSALVRFPIEGDRSKRDWLAFHRPVGSVVAYQLDEVLPALEMIQSATEAGYWAVGMVSYDAGPAFDPAIASLRHHGVPLVAFGFYRKAVPSDGPLGGQFGVSGWASSRNEAQHAESLAAIKNAIARGDTYQVNHTLRLRSRFTGDPLGFFAALARAQPTDYLAYLDLGRAAVCSASPEMFFERHGQDLITRPMKGTRPRLVDPDKDQAMIEELLASEKDRAENTMIVDMARNDLGRIAEVGSVQVTHLHQVESYPTVHQLTSTVTARAAVDLTEIFEALFPAASITGAPKISTSRIITDLEAEPRGIYTGTVGAISPDHVAVFNVAIRTAWVDRLARTAEYGIGGGIVWDSEARSEWQEAKDKARILSRAKPSLRLLETMRWSPDGGIGLLEEHMSRLESAADHFGYRFEPATIRRGLDELGATRRGLDELGATRRGLDELAAQEPLRIRLLLDFEGAFELETAPLGQTPKTPVRAVLDSLPVDLSNEFLYYKTTERSRYAEALARCPEFDDVILWNQRGEVTETTVANIVVEADGRLITPPISSGLLAGTMRERLLADGKIEEGIVPVERLAEVDQVFVVNSVRGWRPVDYVYDVDDAADEGLTVTGS